MKGQESEGASGFCRDGEGPWLGTWEMFVNRLQGEMPFHLTPHTYPVSSFLHFLWGTLHLLGSWQQLGLCSSNKYQLPESQ